jgi:alkylhydroperoxidase/carboxymuconolactone decarboxylase family protein YurZ
MTTFLRTVPAAEATGTLKELYDEDTRLHGRVRGATEMLSLRPAVSQAWRAMDGALQSTMDPRYYELATIVAAVSVGCSA